MYNIKENTVRMQRKIGKYKQISNLLANPKQANKYTRI